MWCRYEFPFDFIAEETKEMARFYNQLELIIQTVSSQHRLVTWLVSSSSTNTLPSSLCEAGTSAAIVGRSICDRLQVEHPNGSSRVITLLHMHSIQAWNVLQKTPSPAVIFVGGLLGIMH